MFADSTLATTIPAGAAAGGAASPATAAFADLGDVADTDALVAALPRPRRRQGVRDRRLRRRGAGGDSGAGSEAVTAAGDVPCAEVFGTDVVELVTARLDGVDVVVGVFDGFYVALDVASCDEIAIGEL